MKKFIYLILLVALIFPTLTSFAQGGGVYSTGDTYVDPTILEMIKTILKDTPCHPMNISDDGKITCEYPGSPEASSGNIPLIRTYESWPKFGMINVPVIVPFDYAIEESKNLSVSKDDVIFNYLVTNDYGDSVIDKIKLEGFHVDLVLSSKGITLADENKNLMISDSVKGQCNSDSVLVKTFDDKSVTTTAGAGTYEVNDLIEILYKGETDDVLAMIGTNMRAFMPEIEDFRGYSNLTGYEKAFVTNQDIGGLIDAGGSRTNELIWEYFIGDSDADWVPRNNIPYAGIVNNFEDYDKLSNDNYPYIEYAEEFLNNNIVNSNNGLEESKDKAEHAILMQGACPTYFSFTPIATSSPVHLAETDFYNGQPAYAFYFETTWYLYARAEWSSYSFYNENYTSCQEAQTEAWENDWLIYAQRLITWTHKFNKYIMDYKDYLEELAIYQTNGGTAPVSPTRPNKPEQPAPLSTYLAKCGKPWEVKQNVEGLSQNETSGAWRNYSEGLENRYSDVIDMRYKNGKKVEKFLMPIYQGQLELLP